VLEAAARQHASRLGCVRARASARVVRHEHDLVVRIDRRDGIGMLGEGEERVASCS
jgi:hypothetical protein